MELVRGDYLVADAEDSAEGVPLNGQECFVVVSGGVGCEEVFGCADCVNGDSFVASGCANDVAAERDSGGGCRDAQEGENRRRVVLSILARRRREEACELRGRVACEAVEFDVVAVGFQVTAQAPGAGAKAKVSKTVSLTVRATPAPASLVSHKPTPSTSPSPTPSSSPSTTPTPSPEPMTAEPTPEPTVDTPVEEPTPEPPAQPEPAPQQAYYSSCREAKAAGAAPLYRGDPGYRSGLDRDGDGVACEK